MSFTSITQRFVVWFLLISLLPILLIGYSLLYVFEKELQQSVSQQISAIADKKVDQIDAYLRERVNDALHKSQSDTIRLAMGEFARAFDRSGVKSAEYRRLDASYRAYFKRFVDSTGYYDLFLISPQGRVIYSYAHEADFATNLLSGPSSTSSLAKVTRNALDTLDSSISGFELYAPSGNAIAAFVAVPVMIKGRLAGVLALQIDHGRVFQVLLDSTGLGNSGETIVARLLDEHTALVMAPLKIDPDAALKRKIPLDDKQRAAPLLHALNGERGSALALDYRGVPVVAAWRYLPRLGWGMVTKMDTEEAFAPLYRMRNFGLMILGVSLFATLIGAFLFGRRVVIPLKMLSNNARNIAAGKLDQRATVVGRDELGQLAASFNTMAERLQPHYDDLENQVRQRTSELTQSLENLRIKDAAIASSINAIAIAGKDGKLFYVNQAFVDLWRLQGQEDAIGHSPTEFWGSSADAQVAMEALQQHGHWQGELLASLKDGTKAYMQLSASMVMDVTGLPICTMGSFIDISRRRLSEARLNEAQRLAKVGSWELNLLTGELVWSDEIFRLFEIDKTRFGATYSAFLNAIHPEDRELVNLAYTESLKDRKPYEVVHRLLMRNGCIKWVQERCETDFDSDGKPLFSRGTVQDVTLQKSAEDLLHESETRYHSVVAALSEGIVLTAKNGAIIAANESAQQILGLSLDQMNGRMPVDPRWRPVHEDGSPFSGDTHPGSVTLRTGKPQSNVIMGVHKPDGRLTWISINSQPIFQPGELLPSTVVASFVDITERKRGEEVLRNTNEELERRVEIRTAMLRAAKEEAEQANNSKSLFLTSMSHELRTPLNAILGYAQLMQIDTGLPESVIDNANEIKRAGEVLLSLMNDVLDLSRIESGRLYLENEVVPLCGVLKSCHSHNIQAAKSHHVSLLVAESCSAYQVLADQRGLLQVLNNLVSNAIKYNREGGRVNVSCTVDGGMADEQRKIRISVMDTGIGIASDKQSQLFQPFNRLGAEMSSIEGTGIGLVISRKLIEGMNGVIGVESIHGLGSTFWIELPLVGQVSTGLLPSAVAAAAPAASRKVPHVLVAEDYAPNQNVLLLQLQTMGCRVDIAAEGAAALKMWRKKPYDLILTDIDMPVMNGTEFAKAVRKEELVKGGRIPIVAITATSTNSELQRYEKAGIDDVLGKPLSMDILRNGLMRWLGELPAEPSRTYVRDTVPSTGSGETNAILDINYLYQILGQVNLVQARILVDTFMRTADEGLQLLNSQTDNAAVVAKEMHKQKSSARTVGALHYANLAAALEQQTKDKHFTGIASSLSVLRQALTEIEAAASNLLETQRAHTAELVSASAAAAPLSSVICHSALVVDDDLVVLHQVKAMLGALGVSEVLTAINGLDATRVMAERGGEIEVLVCDLSMPEMDGVELIRRFGKIGFKGGLILISGADEKIISTVNKLAVLQGLRVLGQLQKPVSAAQLAILLAHTSDLPSQQRQAATGPVVSKEAIRAAMAANEFSIWFQPKVEATNLRVVGMEALARWQLPNGKFISPDNFITVAEREGLIGELSQSLVSIALAEAAKLFAAGFPLKVAINLSGTWLNDLNLPEFILSRTRAAGLQAADVILEVTETGVMEDLTTALDVLSRLRLKGFGLSIDDFGIGYSSFEQLGLIPFTEMKLDRSFVSKGVEDAAARAILESSMDMAHKLGLSTVAEGVETELDLKLVRSLGCDLVQGYLIAKPMPVKEMLVWLESAKNKKKGM
ncbi:MAG TPA: EAL domain-containing protein [Gallionellaceae bacterium]|nr:EAL domain-containing protein [Gallionellaceae bacterium]